MKNTLLALTAISALAIAAPVMAASVTSEVRFGDVSGNTTDSREYKLEYSAPAPIFTKLNLATELTVKQGEHEGAITSKLASRLETPTVKVFGVVPVVYGEFGNSMKQGNNFSFVGAGVKASKQIVGPLSATVGYRHRQGLETTRDLNEDRLNAGLTYALNKNFGVGVQYYRTTGAVDSDQVGLQLVRKF